MEDLETRVRKLEELLCKLSEAVTYFAKTVYEAIKYQEERINKIEEVVLFLLEDYKARKEFFRHYTL